MFFRLSLKSLINRRCPDVLEKTFTLSYTPGSPGVSVNSGSPARPAYDEVVRTTEQVYVIDVTQYVIDEDGQQVIIFQAGHYETRTITRIVHHPAVAARPPSLAIPPTASETIRNLRLGWNSGAHSILRLTGDVEVKFKIPSAMGVFIGLTNTSLGVAYREILYALYFHGGVVDVYEAGVARGIGTIFDADDEFMLRRVKGVVTYYRNAVLLYTSAVASSGSLIVDSALYSGGDRVN